MKTSRRKFVQMSMLASAGTLFSFSPLEALAAQRKRISPNDKVHFGVIGCNGMGWSNMRAHLSMDQVECVALCDVDDNVLERRAADVERARGKKPKLYKDYRKLLEQQDIDAVIIGSPDH